MKVKTSDLQGAALDWAVAAADRGLDNMPSVNQWMIWDDYHPTKSWSLTGPLRDKYRIDVMDFSVQDEPLVSASYENKNGLHTVDAETALIAICRAVAACKLGDEVEIPDALIKEKP